MNVQDSQCKVCDFTLHDDFETIDCTTVLPAFRFHERTLRFFVESGQGRFRLCLQVTGDPIQLNVQGMVDLSSSGSDRIDRSLSLNVWGCQFTGVVRERQQLLAFDGDWRSFMQGQRRSINVQAVISTMHARVTVDPLVERVRAAGQHVCYPVELWAEGADKAAAVVSDQLLMSYHPVLATMLTSAHFREGKERKIIFGQATRSEAVKMFGDTVIGGSPEMIRCPIEVVAQYMLLLTVYGRPEHLGSPLDALLSSMVRVTKSVIDAVSILHENKVPGAERLRFRLRQLLQDNPDFALDTVLRASVNVRKRSRNSGAGLAASVAAKKQAKRSKPSTTRVEVKNAYFVFIQSCR